MFSKKQMIVKAIFYYSLLIYPAYIISSIYVFFNGFEYSFISDTVYYETGFEAVESFTSLIWILFLSWFWVPMIIFQICYKLYEWEHPEIKKIKLKQYLINWKFYILPISIILYLCIEYIFDVEKPLFLIFLTIFFKIIQSYYFHSLAFIIPILVSGYLLWGLNFFKWCKKHWYICLVICILFHCIY